MAICNSKNVPDVTAWNPCTSPFLAPPPFVEGGGKTGGGKGWYLVEGWEMKERGGRGPNSTISPGEGTDFLVYATGTRYLSTHAPVISKFTIYSMLLVLLSNVSREL